MRATLVLYSLFLVLGACDKATSPNEPPSVTQKQPGLGDTFILLADTPLRLAPSDESHVAHPYGGPLPVDNWVGRLPRGTVGTVRQMRPGWAEIKLKDDAEGWVHVDAVMPQSGITEATVLDATALFADSGAPSAMGIVPAGALIFALEKAGERTRVHIENVGFGYMTTKSLVNDAGEVEMGRMVIAARAAVSWGDFAEASETLDEARLKHPNSTLLNVIAEQVDIAHMHESPHFSTSRMGTQY